MKLRQIINASGTMTVLGASAAVPEAISAASEMLPRFVEMDDLQRVASRAIAAATGAEAGFVTACASAGITLTIAGAMTGNDLDNVHRLPNTRGMKNRVVIQRGHLIDYGAPIDQAIRIAGARVAPVGRKASATQEDLNAALDGRVAAALYVVSHHTMQTGQIPFDRFAASCRRHKIPLIVDAAAEYDLKGFAAAGADVVIHSAHKFLGGLTAGIVAGRKSLVRAAYLQNLGIGRGMKVGKEGVVGAIAALAAWKVRNHAAALRAEEARVALWMGRLSGVAGIRPELSPDPTGNPITRVRVWVDPAVAGTNAWEMADIVAEGDPAVIVRDDEVEHGYFELDPCNLDDEGAAETARRIVSVLAKARSRRHKPPTFADWTKRHRAARLAWPDLPSQRR